MAQVFLGAATIGRGVNARISTVPALHAFLEPFKAHHHNIIDTARAYVPAGGEGTSEVLIGEAQVEERGFVVDTKVTSFFAGAHKRDSILRSGKEILEALKTPQVNVLYLHAPDRKTPFEETIEAMNQLYQEGVFREFGLSNYTAEEVETIVAICKEKNLIPPTVYQGQYNALCRAAEKELFPTLRRHGLRFVGWSPLAGGALTGKLVKGVAVEDKSRFDNKDPANYIASMYAEMYQRDSIYEALEHLKSLGQSHNLTPANIALRWTRFHSILNEKDALIIGASSVAQLESNLIDLEGGNLPQEIVSAVEGIWEIVVKAGDAPSYHF